MSWNFYRCHSISFVVDFSDAKFEEHCSNVSWDILYSLFCCFSCTTCMYDVFTFLICIKELQYLKNERIYSKRENSLLVIITGNYFKGTYYVLKWIDCLFSLRTWRSLDSCEHNKWWIVCIGRNKHSKLKYCGHKFDKYYVLSGDLN